MAVPTSWKVTTLLKKRKINPALRQKNNTSVSSFFNAYSLQRWKAIELCASDKPVCVLAPLWERKCDSPRTACMSHYVVSWCRAEPVALLIKASLSHVSGSFSLSADSLQHSAACISSGFNQRFCLTCNKTKSSGVNPRRGLLKLQLELQTPLSCFALL